MHAKQDLLNEYHLDFLPTFGNDTRITTVRVNTVNEPKSHQIPESGISCPPKLINDARHILPFRTLRYMCMSPITDSLIRKLCTSDHSGSIMTRAIGLFRGSMYKSKNDTKSNNRTLYPFISKDVLSNQKVGIFDTFSNREKHISSYLSHGANMDELALRAISNLSSSWTYHQTMESQVDYGVRGLIPFPIDILQGRDNNPGSTCWSSKFVNEVFSAKTKYNKEFEATNIGAEGLAKRLYKCIKKLGDLLELNADTPADLEKLNRAFRNTNSVLPSDAIFPEVLTAHDFRSIAKKIKVIPVYPENIRTVPYKEKEDHGTPIKNLVFPFRVPTQITTILNPNNLEKTTLDLVTRDALDVKLFGMVTSQMKHDFSPVDMQDIYSNRIYLYLLSYIALGVYYTIKYPGFKENIRATKDTAFIHNANLHLYELILEVIIALHRANDPILKTTQQLLMLHTDSSKEFDEFIETMAEIYGIMGCARSRVAKISLLASENGEQILPIPVVSYQRSASDLKHLSKNSKAVNSSLSVLAGMKSKAYNYNSLWVEAMSKAIEARKERRLKSS